MNVSGDVKFLADDVYGAAASIVFPLLHAGARVLGADPTGLRQRSGAMPECAAPCLWLHGASAGEMAAAANLAALLRARGLRFAAAYTTTNDAGLRLVRGRLAAGDVSALAPWDAPRWVGRVFDRWRPAALVLIETELWPALIGAAAARRIPVVCASARIYPRDVARYRLIRRFLRPTFERLTAVLAQSERELATFVALGVPSGRCVVAGNLKHAVHAPAADEAAAFRRAVGLADGDRVWTVGSLHADETELLLAACALLPAQRRRVIVAPRHRAAQAAIEAGASERGWALGKRSAPGGGTWQILLLDTMGELRTAYAGSDLALIGGSFAPHGGHDVIEPLRCGVPVLFGPHSAHAEPEASALRAATPAAVVATAGALAERIDEWMSDESQRQSMWARQVAALPDPAEIGQRYAAAIAPWLQACRPPLSLQPSS
jgi:3-deoxy-D-manno-octulosonic-acid transferase